MKKLLKIVIPLLFLVVVVILFFANSNLIKKEFPVLLYHQLTEDISETGDYCITVEQLENDLKYLKENGYETITTAELLSYIKNDNELPAKPVMLTFDDGNETVLTYLLPLLQKYDMSAVVSIVGDWIGDDGFLTWEQVTELAESDKIEIQNHSYDLHRVYPDGRKGLEKLDNETFEEYSSFVSADVVKLQNLITEKTGQKPTAFTYPWGINSDESKQVLKEIGFEAAFIVHDKINYIDCKNTEWLYQIGRINRPYGISSAEFFDDII